MLEDRIYVGWKEGYFLTTAGSGNDFQRKLSEMVNDLGRPDIVEFRAGDEGFISGGDDLEDPDSATDIIPLRESGEVGSSK